MTDRSADALEAMNEAVLAIAAERSVERVLQRIVEVARELAGARYAALGIPDGEGGFAQFITTGMTEQEVAAMGPLPRTHGLLGAMLEAEESQRTPDITGDPRSGAGGRGRTRAWAPSSACRSCRAGVIAAFYLTDREGADEFSDEDQHLIEMLAAHAALAIESARLYERSRELSAIEERNRLARDLHDSVVQKLFGIVLAARSAGVLLERDCGSPRAGRPAGRARPGGGRRAALARLPAAPAEVETDGLGPALRKHVEVLRRVHRREIELEPRAARVSRPSARHGRCSGSRRRRSRTRYHSDAAHIAVRLRAERAAAADGRGRRRRLRAGSAALRLRAWSRRWRSGGRARWPPQRRVATGRRSNDRAEVPLGDDSRPDRG